MERAGQIEEPFAGETSRVEAASATAIALSVGYVSAAIASNIMSLRMVAPLGIVMDAGTILYPVTFVLRDELHCKAGLKACNLTINLGVICNIVMFLLFALVAWLPADPATGPQAAFGEVLMPGFLVVAGSVVGMFVSEHIDGRIFERIYQGGKGSHFKAATLSNLVSIPIDSMLMSFIAFGLTIPFASVVETCVANIVIKYVVMAVAVAASEVPHRGA